MIKLGKKAPPPAPLGLEGEASLRSDGEYAIEKNAKTANKQRLVLYGVIGLVAIGGIYYVIKPDDVATTPKVTASDGSKTTQISTADIANRNLSDKEWMSTSQVQLDAQSRDIKGLQGDSQKIDDLQKKIDSLQGENTGLKTDGTQVLGAYQKENNDLKSQIQELRSQQERIMSGPNAMYGATGPAGYLPAAVDLRGVGCVYLSVNLDAQWLDLHGELDVHCYADLHLPQRLDRVGLELPPDLFVRSEYRLFLPIGLEFERFDLLTDQQLSRYGHVFVQQRL